MLPFCQVHPYQQCNYTKIFFRLSITAYIRQEMNVNFKNILHNFVLQEIIQNFVNLGNNTKPDKRNRGES